ncbi:unnamed protein product, partial [Owenia fusiformis]
DAGTCVDIIFIIDVSCTVVKQYQRQAIEVIKRFIKEVKFKGDETGKDSTFHLPIVRLPFTAESSDNKGTIKRIIELMSAISYDQKTLSNVGVIAFHKVALNTSIPFQNNRRDLEKGLKKLLKYEGICKTHGDSAYDKAVEMFDTIPKRDRNIVVVFGDGRNTGTKHQSLSEQAMERLKSEQNVDVIWVTTPTKILKTSKTASEQAAEIIRGQMHIERHVKKTQIFDIRDNALNTKLYEHVLENYVCEN